MDSRRPKLASQIEEMGYTFEKVEDKDMCYMCKFCGEIHRCSMRAAEGRYRRWKKDGKTMLVCYADAKERFHKLPKQVGEMGHIFVRIQDDQLFYKCGRCNTENKCLVRCTQAKYYEWKKTEEPPNPQCKKCSKARTYEKVMEIVNEAGLECLLKEEDFEPGIQIVPVKCTCGNVYNPHIGRIIAGSRCMECRQERTEMANMEKYDAPISTLNPEVWKKRNDTMIERYGTVHALKNHGIMKRMKENLKEKYGVEHISKLVEVKKKKADTCFSHYGVKAPMQCPDIFFRAQQTALSKKSFILPSSKREIFIQGYEHITIRSLLEEKHSILQRCIKEDEILVGNEVPVIQYVFNGTNHVYYPDIHIKNTNILIEVKSTYTYDLAEDKNIAKFEECAKQGYILQLFVYDTNQKLVDMRIYQ